MKKLILVIKFITMIGVDITSIKRFENKSDAFVKKVLSNDEYQEWLQVTNQPLYLAQRWAIKEALFKANNDLHDFSKVNLTRNQKGIFLFKNFKITTSKEDDYVIAFVMEEKNE